VDEQPTVPVVVPDVPTGQQAVDDLLVSPVRVPGEAQPAADEHPAEHLRLGDRPAGLVVERHPAADRRPADRPRRAPPPPRRPPGVATVATATSVEPYRL